MLRQALSNSSDKPPVFLNPYSKKPAGNDNNLTPLPWNQFFDVEEKVSIPGTSNIVQVYRSPAMMHPQAPIFVLMHGCGLSSLSWAPVASLLSPANNVIAFDFRGHGLSSSENDIDLSVATLVDDTVKLLDTLLPSLPSLPSSPSIVLVGHSMGGAIAAHVAASGRLKIAGLAVVDVVEGTALAALGSMQGVISRRPLSFPSLSKAIEWAISSDILKNQSSARVSIPSQLIYKEDTNRWEWRIDLAATEPYWRGWFTRLSELFLGAKCARLLLLAGTDRLDKELMVGQMQGKFQLVVLPGGGHHIHEDVPQPTADALIAFASRHQFGKPLVLPPKMFPIVKPPLVT